MESSQAQLQHGDGPLETNRDEAAYGPALTLREITNRSSKHLHDPLERAGSGSLQRRESNSAASRPDAHDTADGVSAPQQEPPGFHEMNIAQLIKAAAAETAEQDSGKHRQPDDQMQAPLPDLRPERSSAASGPDAHASADRVRGSRQDPLPFIELNIPELRKIAAARAAKQDSGKHCQPDGQPQAPISDFARQRIKPSPPSNSAASSPDARASADRVPGPRQEPLPFIELNIPELRKIAAARAAKQDSGKHGQPDGQPQAALPDPTSQRTKPSPHVLSLPVQAGRHSHAKHAQTSATVQDPARHSSRNDSADRFPGPQEPFIEVNIAELRKVAAKAAKQDCGKRRQPDGQRQAPLPDSVPQRTKPSPHILSLPVQAGHHAHAKHAQTSTTIQDPAKHSSGNELQPAGDCDISAASAAQLVGMHRRATTDSDQKAPRAKQPNSMSAAHLHRDGDAKPEAGPVTTAALVKPQGLHPYEASRAFQPPLSADPDNLAAWDTPRLEQLPVKLPEPRTMAHPGAAALDSADPACKAGSAYDSPRAAQARGGEGMVVEESADGTWPAHVVVVCNSNVGKFLLVKQTMVCTCKLCQNKAAKLGVPFVDMTPTEFERHSGSHRAARCCCCAEQLVSVLHVSGQSLDL